MVVARATADGEAVRSPRRALVVGSGFLGGAIARALHGESIHVTVAARSHAHTLRCDVRNEADVAAAVRATEPDTIVLVHGPGDIDWCEANPERAERVHRTGAKNAVRHARDAWIVLVSTDNVFAGTREAYEERDTESPANAYGRAKLAAERVVADAPRSLIWRISLVYGWRAAAERPNFFAETVRRLAARGEVEAPVDQWTTPVVIDDVAAWAAALARSRPVGTLHQASAEPVTRFDFATRIARALGRDPSLVRPVERARSRYACRPPRSCLTSCSPLRRSLPRVRGVDAGIDLLLAAAPAGAAAPVRQAEATR